jgi:hypothetical protein
MCKPPSTIGREFSLLPTGVSSQLKRIGHEVGVCSLRLHDMGVHCAWHGQAQHGMRSVGIRTVDVPSMGWASIKCDVSSVVKKTTTNISEDMQLFFIIHYTH